jgi:hypothetical protein
MKNDPGKQIIDLMDGFGDRRMFGFGDMVVMSGIDARQLRNALDRGLLKVGEKHRNGRWEFSIREALVICIVAQLSNRAWMPISTAIEVALQMRGALEPALQEIADLAGAGKGSRAEFLIYSDQTPQILLARYTPEGQTVTTLDGEPVDMIAAATAGRVAHIRMSLFGLIDHTWSGLKIALDQRPLNAADMPE